MPDSGINWPAVHTAANTALSGAVSSIGQQTGNSSNDVNLGSRVNSLASSALAEAGTFSAIGGAAGSVVPVLGTAVGAAAGALVGLTIALVGGMSHLLQTQHHHPRLTYSNILDGYRRVIARGGQVGAAETDYNNNNTDIPFACSFVEFLKTPWQRGAGDSARRAAWQGPPTGTGYGHACRARAIVLHNMNWFTCETVLGPIGHILKTIVDGSSDNGHQDDGLYALTHGNYPFDDALQPQDITQAITDIGTFMTYCYQSSGAWGSNYVPQDVPIEPNCQAARDYFIANNQPYIPPSGNVTPPPVPMRSPNRAGNASEPVKSGFGIWAAVLLIGGVLGLMFVGGKKGAAS